MTDSNRPTVDCRRKFTELLAFIGQRQKEMILADIASAANREDIRFAGHIEMASIVQRWIWENVMEARP